MANNKFKVIAMDGAAASGKSSTAKILADKLNFLYVDSGAHYRMLTVAFLKMEVDLKNIAKIVESLAKIKLSTKLTKRSAGLVLNGQEIDSDVLRSEIVNAHVSIVAKIAEVRDFLLNYQRSLKKFAMDHHFEGLIMEGRDIGSVVFPDADFSFFFYADEKTREKRRALQGQSDAIALRDKLDSQRKTAPLQYSEKSILVDTSSRSIEEVVESIYKTIKHEQ